MENRFRVDIFEIKKYLGIYLPTYTTYSSAIVLIVKFCLHMAALLNSPPRGGVDYWLYNYPIKERTYSEF